MHSDSSLSIINIAMTAGMLLGLHRSSNTNEYINYKNFDKSAPNGNIKAWAACNIVAQ